MLPSPILPSATRVFAAALATALWLGVSAAAGAATSDGTALGSPKASEIGQWKGRFCTATSCRDTPATPLSAAASFGAAVLAIGWLARRSGARPAGRDSGSPAPGSE